MKDIKAVLHEGDPGAGPEEQGLSPAQAAALRRHILNATVRPDVVRTPWQQPLAVAAMVALTIAAGVAAGMRFAPAGTVSDVPAASTPADGRRQLQFSTPGGTRIIWVFDPEFQVKETVP